MSILINDFLLEYTWIYGFIILGDATVYSNVLKVGGVSMKIPDCLGM